MGGEGLIYRSNQIQGGANIYCRGVNDSREVDDTISGNAGTDTELHCYWLVYSKLSEL